jgi:hypothetical protein
VKAARIEKELQIKMRPEERAERETKQQNAVGRGALIKHVLLRH